MEDTVEMGEMSDISDNVAIEEWKAFVVKMMKCLKERVN
jgi:hypothetical protein